MKKYSLSLTLLATAAGLSFNTLPTWAADTYELTDGSVNLASGNSTGIFAGDSFTVSSSILNADNWGESGYQGAWIGWDSAGVYNVALGTSDEGSGVTITGSGFFGIALRNGDANTTTTVDLSYVDVSNFKGQLCVVNTWNDNVTVKLSGDQWAGVEYVFGSVTAEWAGATGANNGNWNGGTQSGGSGLFTRGTGDSDSNSIKERDILALQGDTTLAGITGTSPDYSTSNGNVYANDDYITVTTAGTKLTIAGSGTYAFYGTVGASGAEVSLVMNSKDGDGAAGSGSQTFGGTNHLQDVTVSAGTLALGGTTDISGTVSVASGAELDLSGEITLSSAISNSGTITVADSTTFVLDNLTAIYDVTSNREYYELIINADSGSLTISDLTNLGFILDGETIDWTAYKTEGDSLYVYSSELTSKNLIWSGASSTNTWTTDSSVTDWTIVNTTSSVSFSSGDSVTFGPNTSSFSNTIILGENITAGTVTITGSGYELSGNYKLTATELILDDEETGDTHTFTIAQGTTVQAGTLTETAGQLDLVVNGSLDVTTMTVSTTQDESISGTGKLNVGTFEYSSAHGVSLTISVAEATFGSITEEASGIESSGDLRHLIFGNGTSTTTASVTSMEIKGLSEVQVAANSTLTVTSLVDSSGWNTTISGDGSFIAESATFSGAGTVTISIANFKADSVVFSGSNGNSTISSTNVVIGAIETTQTYTITIADGGKLTAGEIYRSSNILNLAVNGEVTVEKDLEGYSGSTGMIYFGKDGSATGMAQTLSGTGTANVYGIEAYLNNGGTLTISVANLNIGEGGIAKSSDGTLTINGTTIGLYKATASEISANATIGTNGATFSLNSGETLTVSGVLSGSGTISMTGNGSLTLSGENSSFSGGVTIDGGKVVAANTSALGSGSVTIENGGTLEINSGVEISNDITIVLSTANISTTNPTSVITTYATDTDVYAITGSGLIDSGVKITITVDEELAALLLSGGESYTFNIYDSSSLSLNSENIDYSALKDYSYTWNGDGTITLLPEPALFSLFFSLGALGLVATRRRRRA